MKRYCGSDNEMDESGSYEHKVKKRKKSLLKRLVAEAEERKRNLKESLLVKKAFSEEIPCTGTIESKDTKATIENEQTVINDQNEISKIKNSDEQDDEGQVSSDDSHLSDCDISGKVAVNNQKNKIDKSTEYIILGEADKFKKRKIQRVLPNWLANPITSSSVLHGKDTNVDEYHNLDDNLCRKLKTNGITEFFPVQQEVMPLLIDINKKRWCCRPNDICVSAPTGSGKTLAFVLPVVQLLKDRVVTAVRCLAVLPVRDLAIQVYKVFKYYCEGTSLSVANITGTMTYAEEQRVLGRQGVRGYQSLVDIVIATPGRLIHHIHNTPGFSLQQLRFLILDEADRMMDEIQQGWLTEVEKAIHGKHSSLYNCCSIDKLFCTPKSNIVTPCSIGQVCDPTQKLLYSATLSQDSEKIGQLSLFCPKLFICSSTASSEPNSKLKQKKQVVNNTLPDIEKYTTPAELKEFYALCELSIKPLIVWHLVKTKKFKKVLCFTNSIENSHRLCLVLQEIGEFAVSEYSSRLRGIQRKKAIRKFSSGKVKILVCSDMLARGIDIEDIDCVMLYDVPAHARTYVHRIGRTARAGKEGTAITLVENGEKKKFLSLMKPISRNDFTELKVPLSELEPLQERYQMALKMTANNIESERHQKVQKKHPPKRKSQNVKTTE